MRFEWDADKAGSNLRKHGVSFETAALVFLDPFSFSLQDRIEGGSIAGKRLAWSTMSFFCLWRMSIERKTALR